MERKNDGNYMSPAFPAQKQLLDKERQPGRPRKWGEPTRTVTFRLPVSAIKKLRVIAALQDCTPSDIIVGLLEPLKVPGCK